MVQDQADRRAAFYGWGPGLGILLAIAMIAALACEWGRLGLRYYEGVVPFYDSLSYQDGFATVAQQSRTDGVVKTLVAVWREPGNNVVLYKFAAALLGPVWPGKSGLYVYLYAIQVAALGMLLRVTWRASGSVALGVAAVAAWLAAVPFGHLRDGIGDQRMDLASAAFCLLVAARALEWSRAPSRSGAVAVGVLAALAMLHRPVMATTMVGLVGLFGLRAILRQRRPARAWVQDGVAVVLPVSLIALPWLIAHAADLRRYYLVMNVDLGNAPSIGVAAAYNWSRFVEAFGSAYAGLLGVGLVGLGLTRKVDWLDLTMLGLAAALPLATLALSKSMGNVYVSQLSLGLPALALACARPGAAGACRESWLAIALALLALGTVAETSRRALESEVEWATRNPTRSEVERLLRELAKATPGPRLAAFQDSPVSVVALASLARDLGMALQTGTRAYHVTEFGLPNQPISAITPGQMRQAAETAVGWMAERDDVLILPTAATQHALMPEPFSHRAIPAIREVVLRDARFIRRGEVGPVAGLRFDVFQIRRP